MAKDLGVETFPVHYAGDNVSVRGGRRSTYPPGPTQELPPDETFADAVKAIALLDTMSESVPVTAPWTSPNAGTWDAQTAEDWIRANGTTEAGKNLLRLGVQAILSCEARDVSLLYFLFYIASAGTLENLISTPAGAQESRFVGGSQTVSTRAAKELGRRVVLRSPVRRITQRRGRLEVASDRMVVSARRAIVAISPALVDRIEFHPALPPLRAQLSHRMPLGSVIKVHAIYDEPFWRKDGLTGFALGDGHPCALSWDNTPPGGSPGMLLTFLEGRDARAWSGRPDAERRETVLRWFAQVVGDRALKPSGYVEYDWTADPWSRGCYVGYAPPGVLSDYGVALREPAGLVHWAGTETATRWAGYMDGAIQSGERAADEVLRRL